MKKEPNVAIAMINFNSDDMTAGCLEGLENINYKNKDIWVLDNGSKKESSNKVNKLKEKYKFSFLELKGNVGYAGGANFLIDSISIEKNYALPNIYSQ